MKRKGVEFVPNAAVYCDKERIFKRGFLGVLQLIVETLSTGNAEDDTIKKEVHEKFRVLEYWIAFFMLRNMSIR